MFERGGLNWSPFFLYKCFFLLIKFFIFDKLNTNTMNILEEIQLLIRHTSQVENVYLKNKLKDLKTKMETTASFQFNYLRIEAMEKRIKELEQENECLKAKLEVYGQN